MSFLDSLRRRLIASMLFVFGFGLIAAIVARPFEGRGGLLSRLDVDFIREPYQDVLVLLTFTAAATAIIVTVSAWSLRHLDEASKEAAEAGPRNPHARITNTGLPREVRPMVSAVNDALDRMVQALDTERRFVADAAHELRTPLTVLSLHLQQIRIDGSPEWTEIDRDLGHMSRVVGQLLDLARKEAVRPQDAAVLAVVDVARLAREAAALVLPLADVTNRSIELNVPTRLPVRGRPDDLRDMLRNLLENAITHGQGPIRLTGQIGWENRSCPKVVIEVADEGNGLPEIGRDLLFERFRKADATSAGSGLGLAIAQEVARSHGGSAAFGGGQQTVVRVVLPADIVRTVNSSRTGSECRRVPRP